MIARTPTVSVRSAAPRMDVALLTCALFLQRFLLPFGKTFLSLSLVAGVSIFLHQFFSGKLLIENDRLLWFFALTLAITCSLVLNFGSASPTAYAQFLLLCSLFTLSRPSNPEQYKSTLQAFQILVMILSWLGVGQFVAQFVLDGAKLNMFYGIFPDFLLGDASGRFNTVHTTATGVSLLKANGIFLQEPGTFSQITALGLLIEVLEFRRPRYLVVMTLGFLLAYSGTGLMILALFLPLASLHHGRVALAALVVVILALALFATGILDASIFLNRTGEFTTTGTSGFVRFTSPFWLTAKFFDTGSLQSILLGNGPGSAKDFGDVWYGSGMASWSRLAYEYGLIGSFILVCFLASCLRRSSCPGLLLAALIFYDLVIFTFLEPWVSIMTIVLCTLQSPEPRRGHIDGRFLASAAG
jgi:hypothetical protein